MRTFKVTAVNSYSLESFSDIGSLKNLSTCHFLNVADYIIICFAFQDSLIKPVTKILLGVAVITVLITIALKETPQWVQKFNVFGGNFPPWVLACVVIVFTRMRKRTRDLLKSRGW